MDVGSANENQPGFVRYTSEVHEPTRETVYKFNERVRTWTQRFGFRLGEGSLSIVPRECEFGGYILNLYAPIAEGDSTTAIKDVFYPEDSSCIRAALHL